MWGVGIGVDSYRGEGKEGEVGEVLCLGQKGNLSSCKNQLYVLLGKAGVSDPPHSSYQCKKINKKDEKGKCVNLRYCIQAGESLTRF